MPTADQLLSALAPELDDVDPAVRDIHLDLAESQTGKVFRDARPHAVALLAAHTLTMAGREGVSGAVGNVKEGQLSVGFVGTAAAGDLEATGYGAELARLRRSYIMGARTVIV